MRRLIAIATLVLAAAAALLATGASEGPGDSYEVRALFDNAANLVEGEDVKIAGARVGRVKEMDVTPVDRDDALPDNKAVLVLEITEPGFAPFRKDAECTVRPQGLIGEKFVECDPGQSGEELGEIPDDSQGAGDQFIPVEQNKTPVDIDLVNNTLRLPYRQRLAILINEFGTGLAGRGADLNEAIHRANPALRETDEVLALIARQNRRLERLAVDGDTVLRPLARDRRRIQGFIEEANETAQASAERRTDIERSFERLPRFLPELRLTLDELGNFADEFTPVLTDLHAAAPDLNRFTRALGPFSRAGLPALDSLGEATKDGLPALEALRPVLGDLEEFSSNARPLSRDLDDLTESLDQRGAIEYAMDYIFFQMTAINGFDGLSHYLRANLITNLCSGYATQPVIGCSANFTGTRAVDAGSGPTDQGLERLRVALRGGDPAEAAEDVPIGANRLRGLLSLSDPELAREREAALERIRRGAENPGGPAPPEEAALDYLMGSEK